MKMTHPPKPPVRIEVSTQIKTAPTPQLPYSNHLLRASYTYTHYSLRGDKHDNCTVRVCGNEYELAKLLPFSNHDFYTVSKN